MYTTEKFVEKCRNLYAAKEYDYSLVNYVNCDSKIIIICKIHGSFLQSPNKHLNNGQGCPKCCNKLKQSREDFIRNARKIHNDQYDYCNVQYVNSKTKVEISCKLHGTFFQEPVVHIHQKSGCPECYGTRKLSTEDFINQSKEIHSTKYDYSESNYINFHSKVAIICPHHGRFWQTVAHHLKGSGCKLCNVLGSYSFSYFKNNPNAKDRNAQLYLIEIKEPTKKYYKIGITTRRISERFKHFKFKNIRYSVVISFNANLYSIFCLEQRLLHQIISHFDKPNEIDINGGESECFIANDIQLQDVIDYIKESFEYSLINPEFNAITNLS